jgi:eukaryotic-like serine/threonine-protein kinase
MKVILRGFPEVYSRQLMLLASGTQLGPYEILRPLGAGGMGEVYLARDNKLGRGVAVKVLSAAFTRDPQRMARFEREAKVLASLNHPNIASIYGLDDSSNLQVLVLELVEGPTLADRIKQGAIPVEDALRIAKQIAEALEYAHEHGIVHRDLKPANIKLTDADVVKVLDFGLAKVIEENAGSIDVSTSPTISHMATEVGIILGTAAYMSPEQAKGKSVDRRADIWSFGCVLLEMITGKSTFRGESVTDTLAAVVLKEPDWSGLPESMPSSIRELLERCLKKDQRQRLQAIGDARISIEEFLTRNRKDQQQEQSQAQRRFRPLSVLPWLLVALLASASFWFYLFRGQSPSHSGTLTAALFSGTDIDDPVISPDGEMVVFEQEGKLWLRSMNELAPKLLPGTEDGQNPFWSPDSMSIGYFHKEELRRISAHGGSSTLICQLSSDRKIPPATWGAEDRIVFQSIPDGFFEVSAGGGTARSITKPDQAKDEVILRDPHFLADGKTLVLIVRRPGPGIQLDTIAVQNGSKRSVVLQMPGALLLNVVSSEKTGHLLFVKHNQPNPGLWAVPFSFSKLRVMGKPFLVHANADAPSVSSNGDLVYMSTTSGGSQELSWVDRTGKILGAVGSPKDDMRDPVISPDGKQVALSSGGDKFGIWVMDSTRNTATSLTGGIYWAALPGWLASSKTIAFVCLFSENSEESLCTASADGSGKTQPILTVASSYGFSVSPDQKSILFAKRSEAGTFEIWRAVFQKDARPEPFLATQFNELAPQISPDGRYVAYQSDESGRYEVYVRPYPAGDGRWMISTNGGTTPKWSARGDELFYLQNDTLMAVSIQTHPSFRLNVPHALFSGKAVNSSMVVFNSPLYDVAPDGKRFAVIRDGRVGPRSIVAEQDWLAKAEKQ